MKLRGYKKAAVVFLISRVGTSEEARKFLDELGKDKEVGHMVYSSKDDLSEKLEVFKAYHDNAAYTGWVRIYLHFPYLFSACGSMS
jgi:GH25 family lysozyme M1 (1,4-beta-N-acetylmuramidase)